MIFTVGLTLYDSHYDFSIHVDLCVGFGLDPFSELLPPLDGDHSSLHDCTIVDFHCGVSL